MDAAQAVHRYRLAALQGNVIAKASLRHMYDKGLVPISADDLKSYRKDANELGIYEAKYCLDRLANSGNFVAKYYLCMLDRDHDEGLMKQFPDEFFYELKQDTFLSEKLRFKWIERLFNETYREKWFFETQAAYAGRPKLSDENLLDLHIAIIKKYYANLSQMAKGYHSPGKVVNFLSVPKVKDRIEKLLELIALVPDAHEDYAEAQFIAAHLNYLKNTKGKEWETHLNLCADADTQNRWVTTVSEKKSDYEETVEMLKAYAQLNKAPDAQDQKESLRQKALKQVGDDSKSVSPLIRLSLLTEESEKRQHYLISLKAVDENFTESRKWIECLKTDKVIDEEKEKELLEDMNQLRLS